MIKDIKVTEVSPAVTEAPVIQPAVKVTPIEKQEVVLQHPADRNPSEWRIELVDEDTIRAVNNTSRNVFEGSIEDFNKILRG